MLGTVKSALDKGLQIGGKVFPVEIVSKDTQSNSNRAAEVTSELILSDKVDLVLVSSAPETVNPVSDQCELNGTPCISTVAPWQAWIFNRGSNPKTGFESTFHFFWGLEDIMSVFANMWDTVTTNRKVGGLFPNDEDGRAWSDDKNGIPALLSPRNYGVVPSGFYRNLGDDFSAVIAKFKAGGCEIVSGAPLPPDFTTFWTQARQQGFRPKAASIAKAILFPAAVEALGDAALKTSPDRKAAAYFNSAPAGRRGSGLGHIELKQILPTRLAHCLIFTSDVHGAIGYYEKVLGLRLSDHSGGNVAFMHGVHGSDHHLLALARSSGPGLHHCS